MASISRVLFVNGVLSADGTPPLPAILESHPGAYTATRTHDNGSIVLFWERHLRRLTDSAKILLNSNPNLLFESGNSVDLFSSRLTQSSNWDLMVRSLVSNSVSKALPAALKVRNIGEELSIAVLVSGNLEKLRADEDIVDEEIISRAFDVYVHVGTYLPPAFGIRENGACLAVVGHGRDFANAKYSEWVRLRKSLEKLRPPGATELLLSNDGDKILEGCTTNFFVVCCKDHNDSSNNERGEDMHDCTAYPFEIQTAPIGDGVLPGVLRQSIIDICLRIGIPLQEVAPSWSNHEMWMEAFITNSLRLLQHVEIIQVPSSWKMPESKSWNDVTWEEKRFKGAPGGITTLIQGLEVVALAFWIILSSVKGIISEGADEES
ncbi:uncharacterized protein LOC127797196 isoform X2 [Diospyros lotus]|uniref:uncharacterized protein LOC127797196 isoform X2 n=1 Tax=Diospyros lotus TaxID=55363 RepID=UPI00225563CA|nr:uncharacterized protein LOC127797196 isoform X2 [Diospyros lotus]